jgi:hypothetical protein
METAARLTLDHPMTFEAVGDALQVSDGSALHNLFRLCRRCRDKLLSFVKGFVDGSDILTTICFDCIRSRSAPKSKKAVPAGWLRDLILKRTERLNETYIYPFPRHSSLHEEFVTALLTHISETHCPSCVATRNTNGEVYHNQLYIIVSMAGDDSCILPLS